MSLLRFGLELVKCLNSNVSFGTSCSSLSANENNSSTACLELRGNELSSLVTTPSLPIPSNLTYLTPFNRDSVPLLPNEFSLPKLGCSNIKDLGFQGGDNLSEAIDLDDAALSFDCGYEIFGSTQQSHPTYTSENSRGLDCLVKERNLSVTESLSHAETALEASASGQECIGFQSSQIAEAASSVNLLQTQ
nr:zinc finger protein CONSTANS-LIKE 12-like [Nicotiana tomentosiformis]